MTPSHTSHRGRTASDGGTHWISYSDMMATLILVFILTIVVCIYQYYQLLEIKTRELGEQQAKLDAAQITLAEQQEELETTRVELMGKEEELAIIQIQLDGQKEELNAANIRLAAQQAQLDEKEEEINAILIQLAAQEEELKGYRLKIATLLGVRTEIVTELRDALKANHINASVDANTGDIVLDSTLLNFEVGSTVLSDNSKKQLSSLMPVYLGVLLQKKYEPYVAEIIIEGHTDSTSNAKDKYIDNMKLSQDRARAVVEYSKNTLSSSQRAKFEKLVTATGKSYSQLIYDKKGNEDMARSRRVEIKFRLIDTEMIEEMNRILSGLE